MLENHTNEVAPYSCASGTRPEEEREHEYIGYVCLVFFHPTRELHPLRRHHYRWMAANLDACSVLMAMKQWGVFNVPYYCDTGCPFMMVISEDPWHSHRLLCVWQWSCHHIFLRLRSVAARIRALNLPHARWTLLPTAPPLQLCTANSGSVLQVYGVHPLVLRDDEDYSNEPPTFGVPLSKLFSAGLEILQVPKVWTWMGRRP